MRFNRIGKRLPILMVLSLLLLMVGGCSSSSESESDDRAIFGGSQTIQGDETVDGDIALLGGELNVEEGAVVNGDIAVLGGELNLNGTLNGDLAVFGGDVEAGLAAEINGAVSSMGGNISAERRAGEDGDRLGDLGDLPEPEAIDPPEAPEAPQLPEGLAPPAPSFLGTIFDGIRTAFGKAMFAIAWGVVGLIATMFVPQHVKRVAETAQRAAAASAVVGFLAIIVAIPLGIIAAITIIGIPVTLLLSLVMAVGTVLGWIAIGYLLGMRLLQGAKVRAPRTPAAAAIGAAVLGLAWGLVTEIPLMGFLANIIWIAGLGAVLLTRGGTQPYPLRRVAGVGPVPIRETPVGGSFATPRSSTSTKSGNLFADLAADLGMDEEDFRDEDDLRPRR